MEESKVYNIKVQFDPTVLLQSLGELGDAPVDSAQFDIQDFISTFQSPDAPQPGQSTTTTEPPYYQMTFDEVFGHPNSIQDVLQQVKRRQNIQRYKTTATTTVLSIQSTSEPYKTSIMPSKPAPKATKDIKSHRTTTMRSLVR